MVNSKRTCYTRQAKEKVCDGLYSDQKGDVKQRRELYRPCLPGSYEVEQIISSRGRGEVFLCRNKFIFHSSYSDYTILKIIIFI